MQKLQGIAEQGGANIVTSGTSSATESTVTYPGCTVTVYEAGTTTLADIFSDNLATPKANPFTASSSDAYWSFYAPDGEYDVKFSGTGIDTPFTLGDFTLGGSGTLNEGIIDVTQSPYNADNSGSTSPYEGIAAAIASGAKRLYLPAGTYKFTQDDIDGRVWLIDYYFGDDSLEIFGDGVGKTIITVADDVTYNAGRTVIANLNSGSHQSLHGMTFQGPSTYTAGEVDVISCYQNAYYPHVHDVEVVGWDDDRTAGAGCITTYQPWFSNDLNVTLGTNIASGTRTVTPTSMVGIYPGRILSIDYGLGTYENVIVTAITATTFTAVFSFAHTTTSTVDGWNDALQYALIEDFDIHDCYKATAVVNNSAGNTFRRGRIKKVGKTTNQHGLYIQTGRSSFSDIWIEGVAGYSIHQYPTFDASGDNSGNFYNNIVSIDPGGAHVLVTGKNEDESDARNPYYPDGAGLSRYTTISNSIFRNTRATGSSIIGNIKLTGPTIFCHNTLEDVSSFDTGKSPYTIAFGNISTSLYSGAAGITENIGGTTSRIGGTGTFFPGANTSLKAESADPLALGAGGNLHLAAGIGSRSFTAVSNLAGAVTVTLEFTGPGDDTFIGNSFSLASGVDFDLGDDDSGTELAVTATNLAAAINSSSTTLYNNANAIAIGPVVYVARGRTTSTLTLTTNQAGRISAFNEDDGVIKIAHDIYHAEGTGPVLIDSLGTKWRLVVDTLGNVSAVTA